MQDRESILFEYNPSPMWIYEIETMQILDVNRAAIRQYGYSREEFLQLTIRDIRPEEEVSTLLKHTAQSRFHAGNIGIWKHQKRNGEPFWVELILQAFEYEGRPVKLVQARVINELSPEAEKQQTLHKQLRFHLFNSPLAVLLWDGHLNLEYISERVSGISGYTPGDLQGRSMNALAGQIIMPENQAELLEKMQDLVDNKAMRTSFDARLRARDGNILYTRWHNSLLTDQEGRLVSVLSMVEDLTSQKELQISRDKLQQTIEATSDFVAIVDASGKVEYMNRSARDITGWGSEESLSTSELHIYDCLSSGYLHTQLREIRFSLAKTGIWEGRLDLDTGSEKPIPVSAVIVAHAGREEHTEYYSVTCRDITGHLESRRKLKEQQQQLKLAMEGGRIGFWSLDLKKNEVKYDRLWLIYLLGYDVDERVNSPDDWFQLIHPDDRERVTQSIKALYKDQTAYFENEFRLEKNDGSWLWTMSRAKVASRNEKGEPDYISGIHMDIDERKRTEERLKQALREQQVLLGEIHHRVKNNLAVVSSLLQLQRLQTDSKELARLLTDSEMRIQSIALVHEKLYETERLSEVDFGNYVRQLARTIKQIHDPGDRVDLQISSATVKLNINQAIPSALILNESLLNAFEHGFGKKEEGKITIGIVCEGNKVCIQICDNGRGLPAEFQQKREETLGLLIVETLARQLEADLIIKNNEDGRGVCVQFSFEQRIMRGSGSALTEGVRETSGK